MPPAVSDDTILWTTSTHSVSLRAHHVTVPDSPERQALIDASFQSTPDLVTVLSRDGRVLVANRSALALAGWTSEDAQGQYMWDAPGWCSVPDLAAWLKDFVARPRDGATATHAATIMAEGTMRTMQFAVRVLGGDNPDEVLQLVALDVSERENVKAQLSDRERRLRMLTDNMHDLLFMVGVDGGTYRVESVNRAYLAATGLTEAQVIGQSIDIGARPPGSRPCPHGVRARRRLTAAHRVSRGDGHTEWPVVGGNDLECDPR